MDLLTEPEVAKLLRVSERTLRAWRASGEGPPHLRLGKGPRAPVRYRRKALLDWARKQEG